MTGRGHCAQACKGGGLAGGPGRLQAGRGGASRNAERRHWGALLTRPGPADCNSGRSQTDSWSFGLRRTGRLCAGPRPRRHDQVRFSLTWSSLEAPFFAYRSSLSFHFPSANSFLHPSIQCQSFISLFSSSPPLFLGLRSSPLRSFNTASTLTLAWPKPCLAQAGCAAR